MSPLKLQFGNRLREIRLGLGLTQEEFAEKIGISVDFLSLIERGVNAPSFKKLERIATSLGVSVDFLFRFSENVTRQKSKY